MRLKQTSARRVPAAFAARLNRPSDQGKPDYYPGAGDPDTDARSGAVAVIKTKQGNASVVETFLRLGKNT